MDGQATITSKTTTAELPRTYLPRPRLDRQWDEWETRRVVVIEASAGYGKTTILAANVCRSGRRVFWFTFGSINAGLPALLTSLGSLKPPGQPPEGAPETPEIQLHHPPDPSTPLLRLLDTIRSTREGWNIVLDDLHRAGATTGDAGTHAAPRGAGSDSANATPPPALTSFLNDLIDNLPAGSTLFLASREPVGIRMNKLRLQEQAVVLTAQDLRFTLEETTALFRTRVPTQLPDPQDLKRIAAKTEGWPAGLGICLQYIEGSPRRRDPDRSLKRVLDRIDAGSRIASARVAPGRGDSTDADGPSWFSYFAEEVLASLDPPIAQFLMRASILPSLTPSLCDDVLGIRDSRALLHDLHRRNLFTFPITPSGPLASIAPVAPLASIARDASPLTRSAYATTSPSETSYRFHPLFQEFLARRLAATAPAKQVSSLRMRAARRLLRDDAWAEAMVLLTDAGDAPSILRLLERRGMTILLAGQAGILLRAFGALDPRDYAARPKALLVLGRVHETHGRLDEAEALYKQALRHVTNDRVGGRPSTANARAGGPPTAGTNASRSRASHTRPAHPSPSRASQPDHAIRLELMTLLIVLTIHRGHHLGAVRLCRQALASPNWTNLRAWGRLVVMLGGCLSELGKCDEAEKEFLRAGKAYARSRDAAGEAQVRFLLATCVHHPRGDFDQAQAGMRRALEHFRSVGDLELSCQCCGILAFLMIENGQEDKARDLAVETLRQAESFRLPNVAGLCRLTLGRCALLRARTGSTRSLEDHAEAASHFAAALEIGEAIAHTDLNIYPRLGLAEVARDQGHVAAARAHAGAALAHARRTGVRFGEAQACVLLGSLDAGRPRVRITWWRRAEKILRAIRARWHLHRLLLLRLQAGDVPAGQGQGMLQELLTGVVEMRHESLLIAEERAAGTRALAAAFRLGIARDAATELLLRLGDDAIPELRQGLEDREREVRKLCAGLIARIGGDEARKVLGPLQNPTTEVGRVAIRVCADAMRRPVPPLRICALGPLRVSIGDRIVSQDDWPSLPALRVFLFLLVARFRNVQRDEILEALWRDESPRRARQNLTQAIHVLRRMFQPDLPLRQPSRYLGNSDEGVRLDPGAESTYDVVQFEGGLARASVLAVTDREAAVTGSGDPLKIERLRKTLALYRGDFAEALPDERCLEPERRNLRDKWVQGASRLLSLLAAARAWKEVIPLADLAIARDPSNETLHYRLITGYCECGNRSAAVTAYRRYEKNVYADPYGHLSERMKELAERIRGS